MKERSELPREMIESLEVYRADDACGSDSVSQRLAAFLADRPEWAELQVRLERLDEVLGRVIRDVPAPEGLESRILDRLQTASSGQIDDLPVASVETSDHKFAKVRAPASRLKKPRTGRRRLFLASAGLFAASVFVVGFFRFWTPGDLTVSAVHDEALRQFVEAGQDGHKPLSDDVLRQFPVASDVAMPSSARWRKLDGFLGREAVAYEMTGWRGNRATLFVVACPRAVPDLANRAPRRSTPATGGKTIGVWQASGRLYVLVVEGNDRDYNALLGPRPALT